MTLLQTNINQNINLESSNMFKIPIEKVITITRDMVDVNNNITLHSDDLSFPNCHS